VPATRIAVLHDDAAGRNVTGTNTRLSAADVVITGTGLFTPPESISNAELVESLSEANTAWNDSNAAKIAAGELQARELPDEAFIFKASGIESRYVMDKIGVLDPSRLRPMLDMRDETQLGLQAEMAMPAILQALEQAGRKPSDVDAVIVGCSNLQRAYPAVSIEIQNELGAGGWAYDMNVACSSATFSLQAATSALQTGGARCVVVANPEITSGHNNFAERDFHFIFGDACTALVIELADEAVSDERWEVLGTALATQFSNNIRNDAGFLNECEAGERSEDELLFRQNGHKVFKEVIPMVAAHIKDHLKRAGLSSADVTRFWLHQANLKMNQLIAKSVLGRVPEESEAPVTLNEFANTSSAGSVIAFHRHRADLETGDIGVICSFGAGYSVGSCLVRKA